MAGILDGEKNFEDIYNRLDSIPACDRWTDRHGIVRAIHMRRAVKMMVNHMVHQMLHPLCCENCGLRNHHTSECRKPKGDQGNTLNVLLDFKFIMLSRDALLAIGLVSSKLDTLTRHCPSRLFTSRLSSQSSRLAAYPAYSTERN